MIRRRTPLKRSTKPIPRKRAKPRRGPLRDPGYLAFLRGNARCAVGIRCVCHGRVGGCDAAHGPVNGMRSKGPDNEAVALCPAHHEEQHRIGWPAFERKYDFSRAEEAEAWYAAYRIWKEHNA